MRQRCRQPARFARHGNGKSGRNTGLYRRHARHGDRMATAMTGAHQRMQEAIVIGAIACGGSTGIVVRIVRRGMQIRPVRGFMQVAQRGHHRLADDRQQQQQLRQMAQATSSEGRGAGGHWRQG